MPQLNSLREINMIVHQLKFSLKNPKIIIKFRKKDLSHQPIKYAHFSLIANILQIVHGEKKTKIENTSIQFTFANVTNDVGTKSVLIIGISIIVRDYSYYNYNLLFN